MKLTKIVTTAIELLVFAVFLFVLYSLIMGSRDSGRVSIGKYSMLNVLTGSMSPTFDAGSLIIIEKVDINLIKDEDIITFKPLQERDILVTHRVIEVLNENSSISLITQGDANTVPDAQEITSKELVGRVVFYANGIGLFLVKLKTPAGIIALVFVVLAITLLLNLPSILKKMNENN